MPDMQNGRRRYQVHCSGVIAEALRQLQRRARGTTRKKAIALAFKRIVERLERAPTQFGEPCYRLPSMRLQVRSCSVSPLIVHFAVYEVQPLVFIKAVRLLSERRN